MAKYKEPIAEAEALTKRVEVTRDLRSSLVKGMGPGGGRLGSASRYAATTQAVDRILPYGQHG